MLACVVAALLVSSVAVVTAASTIEIGPKVGDILVFRPGAHAPADWEFSVAAPLARPTSTCTLRPDVMASGGGSLVVEQRLDRRSYRVHWAGKQTSDGPADCGSTADLVVSGTDLQLLTNAVGGAGVGHGWFGNF